MREVLDSIALPCRYITTCSEIYAIPYLTIVGSYKMTNDKENINVDLATEFINTLQGKHVMIRNPPK